MMHLRSTVPRAGCILPLRIVMTVRWVSARLVVAPYGVDCKYGKQTGKFLLVAISNPWAEHMPTLFTIH